jgi:hypothetical protein
MRVWRPGSDQADYARPLACARSGNLLQKRRRVLLPSDSKCCRSHGHLTHQQRHQHGHRQHQQCQHRLRLRLRRRRRFRAEDPSGTPGGPVRPLSHPVPLQLCPLLLSVPRCRAARVSRTAPRSPLLKVTLFHRLGTCRLLAPHPRADHARVRVNWVARRPPRHPPLELPRRPHMRSKMGLSTG